MSETTKPIETGAEAVEWDLTALFARAEELDQSLGETEERASRFAERYRGKVSQLTAMELADALAEFESIHDVLDRAGTHAFLDWSSNTEDSGRGARMQAVTERVIQINQQLIFFELELIHTAAEKGDALTGDAALARYRHYIELLGLRQEHVLSEPEERIISLKTLSGAGAWSRFFDETLAAARFPHDGKTLTEQEILAKLYDPQREVRRRAAEAFTSGLKNNLRTLTFVFNTLLAEKASDDRLRRFPDWLSSRNLSNEISDAAVESLINSVTDRYDLSERYYALKRKLLGLDTLFDYDRYAPMQEVERRYSWSEARDTVLTAYRDFSPKAADIAQMFFEKRWIDAPVRPGKRSGAFSHRGVPQVHPYILLNFTGNTRDVQTLAHELGHGVHQYLSNPLGSLQAGTPLTTAETASVFGEMLVFERLLNSESDPRQRLALLMSKIDDTMATVFRQIAMNRFEDRIHRSRREKGELNTQQFSQFWFETQSEMFRESVTLTDGYRIWWSYIPHFVHTPGYVYAYAFGELLVLALYALFRSEPSGFVDRYLRLLAAGGSDWPHHLLEPMGVDLRDPGFWHRGLEEIEKLIAQAEELGED
ncbi:MAG: M3 family oligoendopeptidase [Acidobacteriota bacterium]